MRWSHNQDRLYYFKSHGEWLRVNVFHLIFLSHSYLFPKILKFFWLEKLIQNNINSCCWQNKDLTTHLGVQIKNKMIDSCYLKWKVFMDNWTEMQHKASCWYNDFILIDYYGNLCLYICMIYLSSFLLIYPC